MKKTVWTFGLISGAILSIMMAVTVPFEHKIGYDHALIVGYTTMVVSFLLIFFGVRSYRDNVGGGTVRFGRAFAVGALIAGIASLCYVATWEVIFYRFEPDSRFSVSRSTTLSECSSCGTSWTSTPRTPSTS